VESFTSVQGSWERLRLFAAANHSNGCGSIQKGVV
jgi:hypothetical protein